ncbi:MAG: hypothetical protein AMXMBFR23_23630 [Chloroflexota bacterium]
MDAPLPPALWNALGFGDPGDGRARVVAIVGGGGKTALAYRLGWEAAALGRRAMVTGTTRFTRLAPMPPLVEAAPDAILGRAEAAWQPGQPLVLAGMEAQTKGRLAPLACETVDALARTEGIGLIAVEADGSRMRAFKAPGDDEPVIPASATHVVAVVGASILDAPLDAEHVHRPERVRAIVDREVCDATLIAAVLASPTGGRKSSEGRPFAVVVNQADVDEAGAARLGRAVLAAGVGRVVVASLQDAARPVREVLTTAEV